MRNPLPYRPAEPVRILVVDDDELHRELHCMMLERAGYATCTACDTIEALVACRAFRPALVLTDLRMPGLDGMRLAEILRLDPDTTSIPVIMVSSDARELHPRRVLEAGLAALLPKPIEMVDLLDAIAAAVGPASATAA